LARIFRKYSISSIQLR